MNETVKSAPRHTITSSAANATYRHRNDSVRYSLIAREWAENIVQAGGTEMRMFRANLGRKDFGKDGENREHGVVLAAQLEGKYVFMSHDARPFDNDEHVLDSMLPCTRTNEGGAHGCGGFLSPVLAVNEIGQMRCIIVNRQGAKASGFLMWATSDRVIYRTKLPDSITKAIADMATDVGKDWNVLVGYHYNLIDQPTGTKFFSAFAELSRHALETLKVRLFHGQYAIGDSADNKTTTIKSGQDMVLTTEEIDKLSGCDKHTFTTLVKGAEMKTTSSMKVRFNCEVTVKLSPGIGQKSNDCVTHRAVNICNLGDRKAGSCHGRAPRWNDVENCTFITFAAYPNDTPIGSRLSKDPLYCGNRIKSFTDAVGLSVGAQTSPKTRKDKPSFLGDYLPLDAQRTDVIYSSWPYMKVYFKITEVTEIVQNTDVTKPTDPALCLNLFGSTDEFFFTDPTGHIPAAVIRAVCEKLNETKADGNDHSKWIADVQKAASIFWKPDDIDGLHKIKLNSKTRDQMMYFRPTVRPTDGKKWRGLVNPGDTVIGELFWDAAHTQPVLNLTEPGDFASDHNNKLGWIRDNKYILSISDLCRRNSTKGGDVKFKPIAREEWLDLEFGEKAPRGAITFFARKMNETYRLNVEVGLPNSVKSGEKDGAPRTKDPKDLPQDDELKKGDAWGTFGDERPYLTISNGIVKLNPSNRDNTLVFGKRFQKKASAAQELYEDLRQRCLELEGAYDKVNVDFTDHSTREIWDDEKRFFVNSAIKAWYEKTKAELKITTDMLVDDSEDVVVVG